MAHPDVALPIPIWLVSLALSHRWGFTTVWIWWAATRPQSRQGQEHVGVGLPAALVPGMAVAHSASNLWGRWLEATSSSPRSFNAQGCLHHNRSPVTHRARSTPCTTRRLCKHQLHCAQRCPGAASKAEWLLRFWLPGSRCQHAGHSVVGTWLPRSVLVLCLLEGIVTEITAEGHCGGTGPRPLCKDSST